MKCFVPSCPVDFHRLPVGMSKHKFPTDEDRRVEWLSAIAAAENVLLSAELVNFDVEKICSDHFDPAFFNKVGQRKILHKSAVPFTPFPVQSEFLTKSDAQSVVGLPVGQIAHPGNVQLQPHVPHQIGVGPPLGGGQAIPPVIIRSQLFRHCVPQPGIVDLPAGQHRVLRQVTVDLPVVSKQVAPSIHHQPVLQHVPQPPVIRHQNGAPQPLAIGLPIGPYQEVHTTRHQPVMQSVPIRHQSVMQHVSQPHVIRHQDGAPQQLAVGLPVGPYQEVHTTSHQPVIQSVPIRLQHVPQPPVFRHQNSAPQQLAVGLPVGPYQEVHTIRRQPVMQSLPIRLQHVPQPPVFRHQNGAPQQLAVGLPVGPYQEVHTIRHQPVMQSLPIRLQHVPQPPVFRHQNGAPQQLAVGLPVGPYQVVHPIHHQPVMQSVPIRHQPVLQHVPQPPVFRHPNGAPQQLAIGLPVGPYQEVHTIRHQHVVQSVPQQLRVPEKVTGDLPLVSGQVAPPRIIRSQLEQQHEPQQSILSLPGGSGQRKRQLTSEPGLAKRRKLTRPEETNQQTDCGADVEQVSAIPKKRRRPIRYAGDLANRAINKEEAAKVVPKLQIHIEQYRKTIKRLRAQITRLKMKIKSSEQLIETLRSKQLIDEEQVQDLSINKALFEELKNYRRGKPYSTQLRNFATTLHFCSAKAYQFVRNTFNNTLPHPRTITRWYVSVNGEPGITKESLDVLKGKSEERARQGKKLFGCLLMDEIGHRQQVKWNHNTKKLDGKVPKKFSKGSEVRPAKEALFFMVSGIDEPFKIPVGYFLINGISAEAKMDLVNTILIALHDAGVTIISLVFDGTQANISMAHLLGCNLKIHPEKPLVTKFNHPCSNHSVHVLLDVMHMLKLVRNTLHSRKVIVTPRGEARWDFLEKLNAFQIEHGVKLGNKLSNNHINFTNNKMKAIYAIQTISNGCAHALKILKMFKEEFQHCDATIELLQVFNNLFDIFNSMSSDATGLKRPLSRSNFNQYREVFVHAENYIKNLEFDDETKVVHSKNKVGFVGFLVAIKSFTEIFSIYCEQTRELIEIYTYRFSQDHLEIFFGAIRSKSGCNNNPTTKQLEAIYKRLIKNNQIICSTKANCTDFSETLNLSSQHISDSVLRTENVDETGNLATESLSLALIYEQAILIKSKLKKKVSCPTCSCDNQILHSIIRICQIVEIIFKEETDGQHDANMEELYHQMASRSSTQAAPFFDLSEHRHCSEFIIETVIDQYLQIRIDNYVTNKNNQFKPTNRSIRNKLTIFEGK